MDQDISKKLQNWETYQDQYWMFEEVPVSLEA